ncbi:MAG: VIT1/CCC1 family protein [Thermofilaceae archaeon]|nr:VIT1/CCC1 family protein [Thermofilaceae archaeon]MCX8180246.1 VIT1/CCC1 family protein [Thermofilaceae archaeon]MDW8004034.1 VIT1/CCC1 family protein [Thermofilaceae archaeon]
MKEAEFRRYALDELFDHRLYSKLVEVERKGENLKLLEELTREEHSHYLFWRELGGDVSWGVKEDIKLALYLILARLFGKTFVIKYLEGHEVNTVKKYERVMEFIDENRRARLREIIEDERRHELELASMLDELIVKQLGSIALGVSDAIIELTGVLAGFAGYSGAPLQIAAAGLIVGVSAAMSMSAAAYAQAKHEKGKSPAATSAFTGIFYMLTVLVLITPLLIGLEVKSALFLSIVFALVFLAAFTFFSSVITGRRFISEYLENSSLIMSVALASYVFGHLVKGLVDHLP